MISIIKQHEEEMAVEAALKAKEIISRAISDNGMATIVVATGPSQSELLKELTKFKEIDWRKVVVFHLDEYIGISADHPASFRKYLKDHFLYQVGQVMECNMVIGDAPNPEEECKRISSIIAKYKIDLALVGIGENGHLAFNDPPADFKTGAPYIIVELDDRCRQQQVNEGHFSSIQTVPRTAISMSIRQIMNAKNIICFVPDQRKAQPVKDCLEEDITKWHPASILRKHSAAYLYLDRNSSSLLEVETI